jgi:hypothetical protein
MSTSDEFRQYAEEAMRWACQARNDRDKHALTELARTWMQAATASEMPVGVNYSPTDHRTAP